MPYAEGDQKTCSSCRSHLTLAHFERNKRAKDGVNNQCKPCMRVSRRKYREKLGKCSVSGCTAAAVGNITRGALCSTHYNWRRVGKDMTTPVRRRRANGEGSMNSQGYRVIQVNGRGVLEHRWIMEGILDRPLWPDENVHHRNGIRHDNRPDNLELWVRCQPPGRRVEDLLDYVVSHYENELRARLT